MNKSRYVDPASSDIRTLLTTKDYCIDFYQREYVWKKETVEKLLDDLFSVFNECFTTNTEQEHNAKYIGENYNWYYLNVLITNSDKQTGKTFIVDGQQRLTTITLICLVLLSITESFENDKEIKKAREILTLCIYGTGSGSLLYDNVFKLDNDKRKEIMEKLLNGQIPSDSYDYKNKTEENLVARYKTIKNYFDSLSFQEEKNLKKLKAFITFLLTKIILVEIEIPENKDTPMVFEVINDRGEPLKPFQILKGKLIGEINKTEVDEYSSKWEQYLNNIDEMEDVFFLTYFRARYLDNNINELNQTNYHRYIFLNNDISEALKFRKTDNNRIQNIKNFITTELKYYSKLYSSLRNSNNEHLSYEKEIFNFDGQYQIILAACDIDDNEEESKIEKIAKEYDRLHMILRLNNLYDSNEFQDITFKICKQIRSASVENYREIFNSCIKEVLKVKLNTTDVNSLLDFSRFQGLQYTTSRYFYYIFARVENYICSKLNRSPIASVKDISTVHSSKKGFHIEHIFSRNDENIKYFKDQVDFENRRNNIGALLILKGDENISSGNELYKDKLKTYSKGPVWAMSLCENFYHKNPAIEKLNEELKTKEVQFVAKNKFDTDAMEERSRLLFNLVKIIWDITE